MTALERHAERVALTLDQRWGIRDRRALQDYLGRAIYDAHLEISQEAALPPSDDEAALLACFLMRQIGVDESTAETDTLLDFRQKAVHIIDAVEAAGIKLGDLLDLYRREP